MPNITLILSLWETEIIPGWPLGVSKMHSGRDQGLEVT